jgi:hypothetical protein
MMTSELGWFLVSVGVLCGGGIGGRRRESTTPEISILPASLDTRLLLKPFKRQHGKHLNGSSSTIKPTTGYYSHTINDLQNKTV